MSNNAVYFIHAITSLHPGSGTSMGAVDLPVQRERHTQWPMMAGSGIKGVLRATTRTNDDWWGEAFGPEDIRDPKDAAAGTVAFTDARILLFPVRSMKGVFAWVTCPSALERFKRDLKAVGISANFKVPSVSADEAFVASESLRTPDNRVVLEEFDFVCKPLDNEMVKSVASLAGSEIAGELAKRLVLVNDDSFTHYARHATEVVTRIGLDYDTKTVKKGALFYQEFLPPEVVFYGMMLFDRADAEARKKLCALDGRTIQFGGDETIGKGICSFRVKGGE